MFVVAITLRGQDRMGASFILLQGLPQDCIFPLQNAQLKVRDTIDIYLANG
jgi:hypothetical protein